VDEVSRPRASVSYCQAARLVRFTPETWNSAVLRPSSSYSDSSLTPRESVTLVCRSELSYVKSDVPRSGSVVLVSRPRAS
jgi:hypothetical protein